MLLITEVIQNLVILEAILVIKAVSSKDYDILLLAYALEQGALIGVS